MVDLKRDDCKIVSVKVYLDRAEITRHIPTSQLRQSEGTCVNLTGLVDSIVESSVRVKGNKFHRILEVSQDRVRVPKEEESSDFMKRKQDVDSIKDKIAEKEREIVRLNKKLNMTNKFCDSVFQRVENVDAKSLSDAQDILEFHSTETAKIEENIQSAMKVIAEFKKDLLALNTMKDITSKKTPQNTGNMNFMKTLKITLDSVASEENLESPPLELTYIVLDASWTPSYDIRINSNADKKAMQLVYYAEVKQWSGEDWTDVDLQLSTSNPSLSSKPKPLVSTVVRRKCNHRNYGLEMNMKKKAFVGGGQMQMQMQQQSMPARLGPSAVVSNANNRGESEDDMESDSEEEDDGAMFAAAGAEVDLNRLATTFTIPRRCHVETDNTAHKVIIGDLSMNPEIVHYSAPSTSDASVYLQAKTKNDSNYELLNSDKVSVFLDGTFISITNIKQCSPGTNFYLYLGVDPGIKCSYKPVKNSDSSATGWVTTSKVKDHSFVTILLNSKKNPCKVIVADYVPKSNEDKIVVEQIVPKAKDVIDITGGFSATSGMAALSTAHLALPRDSIFKEKDGNTIFWMILLKPGEKKTIDFHYRIAFPTDMNVEVAAADA